MLSESSNYLKQKKYNNKTRIILDDKEGNLLNINFWLNIKSLLDFNTNNEIKVLKNKKNAYINKDLLNKYSTSRYIKKAKNINFVIRNKTSSKFRGVSRNGNIHAIKMRGIKALINYPYNNIQIKNIIEKNIN